MKRILILITICLLFATLTIYAAIQPSDLNPHIGDPGGTTRMEELGNKITGAIIAVAIVVSVAVIMYIGITIMIAAPSERAQVKAKLVPYLVGAVISFTTVSLVQIIANISNNITY
ncbi:MAG: hypothetical protein E7311_03000 [Clostridiales bacterium]|nr:hypothetical protein [Clostridiales bacterium]